MTEVLGPKHEVNIFTMQGQKTLILAKVTFDLDKFHSQHARTTDMLEMIIGWFKHMVGLSWHRQCHVVMTNHIFSKSSSDLFSQLYKDFCLWDKARPRWLEQLVYKKEPIHFQSLTRCQRWSAPYSLRFVFSLMFKLRQQIFSMNIMCFHYIGLYFLWG